MTASTNAAWTGRTWAPLLLCAVLCGCGAKTAALLEVDAGPAPESTPERCNGADDNLNDVVDEDFRDSEGRYVDDQHCGACNSPCAPASASELEVACQVIGESARCAATRCREGFVVGTQGRCVKTDANLCLACGDDADCGNAPGARCLDVGGEPRCLVGCEAGCPDGYRCEEDSCIPEGGSCRCEAGNNFEVACSVEVGDPMAGEAPCLGRAVCEDGVLSECQTAVDVCDEVDNDCDGVVDQDFVDERGAYSVSREHCGQCGVSCEDDPGTSLVLRCGGDPFAPTCVVRCIDEDDGLQPGDKLDGDFDIANGCECTFTQADDAPGPLGAEGEKLDVNCDGADGVIVESLYVASDGDDDGPGSPTRPLRTLSEAVMRAQASLSTAAPRRDIFVAAGTYTQPLRVPAGLRVHGGYRRDFRLLDLQAFETEVRASAELSLYGAALIVEASRDADILVEGMTFRGGDAVAQATPAVGAVLASAGPGVRVRDCIILAGLPGEGRAGNDGGGGDAPSEPAEPGEAPRAAVEDASHQCLPGPDNQARGGSPGRNRCGDSAVFGGAGGSAMCPTSGVVESSGIRGQNAVGGGRGGAGGQGGQNSQGPIVDSDPNVCPSPPCCGLADFTVSTDFSGPQPGSPGDNGVPGLGGPGCRDPFGEFDAELGDVELFPAWRGGSGGVGSAGLAGAGGGGGGAGGGMVFTWIAPRCEFADGLGGGGGGGGAGGCGGAGGVRGTSGAPSVALLVLQPQSGGPKLEDLLLVSADGGRGGPGGSGGEGGEGGAGAQGGELPRSQLTTPTLAQTFPGARGGKGGAGGPGGGGGGGCGGASVGIWVRGGTAPASWSADNRFDVGEGGEAGAGGGGGAPGDPGLQGGRRNVFAE